jgi:hypothetical protein
MKKENILDLIDVLITDYLYFKSVGEWDEADKVDKEIEKYIDLIMAD